MQLFLCFNLLVSLPWLIITAANIGFYMGYFSKHHLASAVGQESAVWDFEWSFHAEIVWKVTVVWAIAILAVWVARNFLKRIIGIA